ncbi:MAG: site-2 protease family protein [Pseudomonadota bacterium]
MEVRPKFRADLSFHFRSERGGRKNVIIQDPISGRYFRLSEYEFLLLRSLDGKHTTEEAVTNLKRTGHHYAITDARYIIGRAAQLGLLLGTGFSTAAFLLSTKTRVTQAQRTRALGSLYYLFIPLLNPDRFLERTIRLFKILASRPMKAAAVAASPGAVYLVVAGLPRMAPETLFFFNWHNLLYLWVTIALTKLVHEFSHAYTAKSFGLHVPEMGVAFLVFFPCLYCNTTDAWQLAEPRQRAAIAAAGIAAEAVLAIVSTYVWYFSLPGLVNSLAFYLMAVSFTSTVLFNGNPLLKFDGYFILIDLLRMPNLAANSLKYLKYLFLNRVMGNELVGNPALDRGEAWIFGTYGTSAFLYRVMVFMGLAVAVYYRFDKMAGIVLAVASIGLFMIKPVVLGMVNMYRHRGHMRPRLFGSVVFGIGLAAIMALLCVPWSSKSVYPCFVGSMKIRKLTVPLLTMVEDVYVREGQSVRPGEPLFKLDTSLLRLKLEQVQMQARAVDREIQLLQLDEKERSKVEGKIPQRLALEDEIRFLKEQALLADTGAKAPFQGVVTRLDYRLQNGFQPGEGAVVGELQSADECVARALVPDTDVHVIREGDHVELWFPVGRGNIIAGRIDAIRSYSEVDLRNSPFAGKFGGELATELRDDGHRETPLEPQYDCSIPLAQECGSIPLGMTGRMAVSFPPRSALMRVYGHIVRTFNRESFL